MAVLLWRIKEKSESHVANFSQYKWWTCTQNITKLTSKRMTILCFTILSSVSCWICKFYHEYLQILPQILQKHWPAHFDSISVVFSILHWMFHVKRSQTMTTTHGLLVLMGDTRKLVQFSSFMGNSVHHSRLHKTQKSTKMVVLSELPHDDSRRCMLYKFVSMIITTIIDGSELNFDLDCRSKQWQIPPDLAFNHGLQKPTPSTAGPHVLRTTREASRWRSLWPRQRRSC